MAWEQWPWARHLDANLSYQWLGRPSGGFDHNWLPEFALGYSLTDKWGIAMEFSGATRANAATPAVTQNLWAVSYTVKPRLVLDSAVQFRLTGNVPPGCVSGRLHFRHCRSLPSQALTLDGDWRKIFVTLIDRVVSVNA